jgi:aspartyl-tRNA(Asn)/glutamyl-tRNA(Gln) amidotransferase subunit A
MAEEFWRLPITELAPLLRRRELSPLELAKLALERIEQLNERLLAFCAVRPELVLEQAEQAERAFAQGGAVGPLCGIPLGIKDLIFTRDLPTVGGSTAYRDFVPDEDDVVVERLRAAGAVILGKTNVPEFGYGPGTQNAVFGVTRNPWDLTRTPGGSSGGSAAAVASGMCPAALGSDGGGSIRSPASYCGVYGIKPTFGLVPLYPGCRDTRFPGFSGWESLEHIGPLSRTVGDAALILDAIAGADRRDRHSLPRTGEPFAPVEEGDLRGLRIAWTTDLGGFARVDNEVGQAVQAAVSLAETLGAQVEQASPFQTDPGSCFSQIVALDSDPDGMRRMVAEQPQAVNPRIARLLEQPWTFEEMARAISARKELYNQLWRFFERYDLLLTPTLPVAAFDLGLAMPDTIGGQPLTEPRFGSWFTQGFNLTGNPAASLPCGWTANGLPIGLQIVGNRLADRLVLRASRAFEVAAPWAERWPML